MDKLEKIFELQKQFDEFISETRGGLSELPVEEQLQKKSLAMLSEFAEVVDELGYKWWKKSNKIDFDNLKEELIDVLHFFVSMCITAGMTADEVFEIYSKKNAENFARQLGKSDKLGYEKD